MYMKAVIGIGVPGSGKTTYLKPLAKREGLAYLSADDIRAEVNGDPGDQSNHLVVMRLLHERLLQNLQQGKGLVIDMTNSRQQDRRKAVIFCRQHGATDVVAYWFNTPLSLAKQRNRERTRVVPDRAVEVMANRLQMHPPSLDEGYDRMVVIEDY